MSDDILWIGISSEVDSQVCALITDNSLEVVSRFDAVPIGEADQALSRFLNSYAMYRGVALAGRGVLGIRGLVGRELPEVNEHLGDVMIDIGSIAELVRRWRPGLYLNRPKPLPQFTLSDQVESWVDELRYYREVVFQA